MTRQEIFEKVVAHFAVQRAASIEYKACMYRTYDGRKCAVGALIPDDAYTPDCESTSVYVLFRAFPDMMQAAGLRREDADFLRDLQCAHDNARHDANFLAGLSERMANVAARFALDPSCLTALTTQREPQ